MYTNQPYQQYPPAAANNPYADNPKLIKQVFTRPSVIGIIVTLGIAITVMLYNCINTISNYMSQRELLDSFSYYSSGISSTMDVTFGITIAIVIAIIIVYLLPFIGFIIMYSKSKNLSDTSSPKAGITLNFVFSIISIIFSSLLTLFVGFIFLILIASASMLSSSSDYFDSYYYAIGNVTLVYVMMFILFAFSIIMILWSVGAVKTCSSMKRTYNGRGLFLGGTGLFRVCTMISIIIVTISTVISIINLFGSSAMTNSTSNPLVQSAGSAITLNNIISLISSISSILLYIFLFAFVSAYKKAVNASKNSIFYNGTNIYTADVSNATAYYQSTYQGPQDNMANPPYNVQNSQPANQYPTNPQSNANNQLNLNKPEPPVVFASGNTPTQNTVQPTQPTANTYNQLNLNKPTQPTAPVVPQPQSTEVICSACGTKNKPESLFCQSCGNSLKAVKATQPTADTNAQINFNKPTQPTAPVVPQTQSTEVICSACGAKNKANSLFCQNCGTRLK